MSEAAALRAFIISLVGEAVNAPPSPPAGVSTGNVPNAHEPEDLSPRGLSGLRTGASAHLDENTVLLGVNGVLNSLALVSLLIEVEDYCEEHDLTFIWPSASAMSPKNSPFRTVASLAEYIEGANNLYEASPEESPPIGPGAGDAV